MNTKLVYLDCYSNPDLTYLNISNTKLSSINLSGLGSLKDLEFTNTPNLSINLSASPILTTIEHLKFDDRPGFELPTLPQREGIPFTGWYDDPTGGSKIETVGPEFYEVWARFAPPCDSCGQDPCVCCPRCGGYPTCKPGCCDICDKYPCECPDPIPATITIEYKNTRGQSNPNNKTTIEVGETLKLKDLDKTDTHTFVGWFTEEVGGEKVESITGVAGVNRKVWAQWDEIVTNKNPRTFFGFNYDNLADKKNYPWYIGLVLFSLSLVLLVLAMKSFRDDRVRITETPPPKSS